MPDLHALGVNIGDVVSGFMPNSYETAVAMYATAAIGATWSSASVDFGPNGVLDRFRQVSEVAVNFGYNFFVDKSQSPCNR